MTSTLIDRSKLQREAWKVSSFMEEGESGHARLAIYTATELDALRGSFKRESIKAGASVIQLFVGGVMMMSDSDDEYRDHLEAIWHATGRVLVNGLGLGCYLHTILANPDVTHVDVIELDQDVVDLVGPYYSNDPRVNIICADAFEQAKRWPAGTRWDVAWHDIWAYKTEDNLQEMAQLARSYGRRCDWQGCWAKEEILYERNRTKDAWWRR